MQAGNPLVIQRHEILEIEAPTLNGGEHQGVADIQGDDGIRFANHRKRSAKAEDTIFGWARESFWSKQE